MRRHWPLAAIAAANVLAAITLFAMGRWTVNEPDPYENCVPIEWTGRTGLLCLEPEPTPEAPA